MPYREKFKNLCFRVHKYFIRIIIRIEGKEKDRIKSMIFISVRHNLVLCTELFIFTYNMWNYDNIQFLFFYLLKIRINNLCLIITLTMKLQNSNNYVLNLSY